MSENNQNKGIGNLKEADLGHEFVQETSDEPITTEDNAQLFNTVASEYMDNNDSDDKAKPQISWEKVKTTHK